MEDQSLEECWTDPMDHELAYRAGMAGMSVRQYRQFNEEYGEPENPYGPDEDSDG